MSNPFQTPNGTPRIYGHRGARGLLPENTMAGFACLPEMGITGVEFDIQNAADGVPVVIHDPHLPMQIARDADGNWLNEPGPRISDLTVAELLRYDVGRLNPQHTYSQRYRAQRPIDGARVPMLAEVLDWASQTPDMILNIEVKSFAHRADLGDPPDILVDSLLQVLRPFDIANRVMISSFDWRVLSELRQHAPDIARGYLTHEQPGDDCTVHDESPWLDGMSLRETDGNLPKLIKAQGGLCWCPCFRDLTRDRVLQAHELGIAVNAWTVNTVDDILAMSAMGVDAIITDYPDRARQILGRP